MSSAKIIALDKIGMLAKGNDFPGPDDLGGPESGPHSYYEHHQIWAYENPIFQRPHLNSDKATYDFLPGGCTLEQAWEKTALTVFLGACLSPELEVALARQDRIVLVFEPSEERAAELLEQIPPALLNRQGLFFFIGDPYSFLPSLQDLLPVELFSGGFPAFFSSVRIDESYPTWAQKTVEYIEILYFRHNIYPFEGQSLMRSIPIRPIFRGLMYDQQLHLYENIHEYVTRPDLSVLRNALEGETAILVAAGPELPDKLEYIRKNQDHAVVICVNNALKPLLEAGIDPHFVVINDSSIDSGKVFELVQPSRKTILVGHVFSDLGGDRFQQKFIFGNELAKPFLSRGMIRLHGSVISTAFTLARLLGCTRCVSIGAQLSSPDPWSLRYAAGSVHEDLSEREEKPLINKFPQLYPVETPKHGTVYTTLNFRDAALWLSEEIRMTGAEFINTTPRSLLFGPGIRHEAEPELCEPFPLSRMAELYRASGHGESIRDVLGFVVHEIGRWENLRASVDAVLHREGGVSLEQGLAMLQELDKINVTYLVERFEDFETSHFMHYLFHFEDVEHKVQGLEYYYSAVLRMIDSFLVVLKQQRKRLAAMG